MNSTPRLIVLAATAALLGTATARSQQTSAQDLQPAVPAKQVDNPFRETQRATANVTVRTVSAPQSHNILGVTAGAKGQDETIEVEKDEVTTWEQARQELYGNPVPPQPMLPMGWISNNTEPLKYDEDKVDRLGQDLIDALKNASNIRQLPPEESITIYVQGQSATPLLQAVHVPEIRRSRGQSSFEQRLEQIVVRQEPADEPTRAVMTLQASKSVIDRFARGEITAKEFRELIRSRIYLSGSWTTPDHLFLNNH